MSKYNDQYSKQQEQNTAKLVMKTFYKMTNKANKNGIKAVEIFEYLQEKFGDVWKRTNLTGKAEETLKRSAQLGFLEQRGERYISQLARGICCRRRRRRNRIGRQRKLRSRSRRRRYRSQRRRRQSRRPNRRRRSCTCGK